MTMLSDGAIIALVVGMGAINFVQRFTPMAVLSRFEMPRPLLRWLSFIPVAVMGSLVASEVLRPGGTWQAPLTNAGIYAAVLTAVVFRFTRSFLGATMSGMLAYVLLRSIF